MDTAIKCCVIATPVSISQPKADGWDTRTDIVSSERSARFWKNEIGRVKCAESTKHVPASN